MPVNARVELRDGYDELYRYAWVGSRATVKDHKFDGDGYEMVYISWDRDYWRDNGESDGWAYATHFKVIEEPQTMNDFIKEATERAAKKCLHCGEQTDTPSLQDAYVDSLSGAFDRAAEGEAFFTLAVKREDPGDGQGPVLTPYMFSGSMNDEATQVLEIALAHVHMAGIQGAGVRQQQMPPGGGDVPGR